MMMWLNRKTAKKINNDLEQVKLQISGLKIGNKILIDENNELKSLNAKLKITIQLQKCKIEDQMEGLQHLNRDLDEWIPLAEKIASIPMNSNLPIKTPKKGIKLLEKHYGK